MNLITATNEGLINTAILILTFNAGAIVGFYIREWFDKINRGGTK